MPLLAITLIAKKAYCQIEDIISNKSNKEIVLLKDELTQVVTISLYSLLSQSYYNLPLGRLRLYSKAIRSSKVEVALLVYWVKLSLQTLALLQKVLKRVINCLEEYCRLKTVVSFLFLTLIILQVSNSTILGQSQRLKRQCPLYF